MRLSSTTIPLQNPAIALVVTTALGLLASPSNAQIHTADWWTFIHCHGSGTDHSADSSIKGANEVFSDDGFNYDQCHGAPGQYGSCRGADASGNTWIVSCNQYSGVCVAIVNCAGGQGMHSCQVDSGSAFSGTQTDTVYGGKRVFVHCDGPGTQDESLYCGQ